MEKIVVVVKNGMVDTVFTEHPSRYDVEIIDLDTQNADELLWAEERLSVIQQHLCKYEI